MYATIEKANFWSLELFFLIPCSWFRRRVFYASNYCHADPQKVVNVPRIQIVQHGCSSKIPLENFKYSAKDFARGGGNTPKGIYNQNYQLKFRQWLRGVNAKAFQCLVIIIIETFPKILQRTKKLLRWFRSKITYF